MSVSIEDERVPAVEEGILIFIFADMCMFALFFVSYLMERNADLATYISSQAQLNQNLGAINTLILLLSSWFVVLAVKALKKNAQKDCALFLASAFFCGVIFIINKAMEYNAKIQDGISILSNDFFMFYYIITGIHWWFYSCFLLTQGEASTALITSRLLKAAVFTGIWLICCGFLFFR